MADGIRGKRKRVPLPTEDVDSPGGGGVTDDIILPPHRSCAICDALVKRLPPPEVPPETWGQQWALTSTLRKPDRQIVICTYDRVHPHTPIRGISNQILVKVSSKITEAAVLRMLTARSMEMQMRFAANFRAAVNIPFEVAMHGSVAHITMPYCGTSLNSINLGRPLDYAESWGIVFQLVYALDVISAMGFERSDLHDGNILLYRLSKPITMRFNEVTYGSQLRNLSVSFASWLLRTSWFATIIDWESAYDRWQYSSTRAELLSINKRPSLRSVEQEDLALDTDFVVPEDSTIWVDLGQRIGRNRMELAKLVEQRSRLHALIDKHAFNFIGLVGTRQGKPLQELRHFDGVPPQEHDDFYFYKDFTGNRRPNRFKGTPAAHMRLFDIEILHANFNAKAPLRGTPHPHFLFPKTSRHN